MQAQSRDELREEIERFSTKLGFATYTAMTVLDQGVGKSEFMTLDNTPADYAPIFADADNCRRDPVLQHCKRHSVPIIWDRETFIRHGLSDMWEEQASFGYHTGIAMALHLPEGRHFFLGVDRDRPLPSDPIELQRVVADLQLFAVHAQDSAMRLMVPDMRAAERPALTPRELEALRWTMDGKTAWETGAILGISERTAVLHINNAMHKLGCVNKHQAVLKALRLGLIH